MKKIILKFHIKASNGNRIYVEDEAKLDEYGDYSDRDFIYLKEGKIPRSLIDGEIDVDSISDEEIGQDSLVQL